MREPVKKIELLDKGDSSPAADNLLLKVLERRAELDQDKSLDRYVKRRRKALGRED
jgi:hypothetical protein